MQPPFGPNLIELGPLIIRMYAVCILSGAMLGGWLGSYRAWARGYNPELAWNGLVLGLILGVAFARAWYVAFAWQNYRNASLLEIINPARGGLAIHGAIVGAVVTVLIHSWRNNLNVLDWTDILAPGLSVGQAVGRWGNFFNQEAYGGPVSNGLPWNLDIPANKRLPGTTQYPPETRFHPTFLYESLWNIGVLTIVVLVERRWGRKLRRGDSFLIYAVLYSIGRFWIEGLRVDKLCTGGVVGVDCASAGLSAARLTSVIMIISGIVLFVGRRVLRPDPPTSAYQPLDQPWIPPTDAVAVPA